MTLLHLTSPFRTCHAGGFVQPKKNHSHMRHRPDDSNGLRQQMTNVGIGSMDHRWSSYAPPLSGDGPVLGAARETCSRGPGL